MKRTILKIMMLVTLIIAPNLYHFSQTSGSPTVSKTQTVAFLIEQNKNARVLISKQENRIKDLESELAEEKENSNSLFKSYESAKSEISSLRESNAALTRAVAINENTIAILQEDNKKQRDKAKNATKKMWQAIAVAAGSIALRFIIP